MQNGIENREMRNGGLRKNVPCMVKLRNQLPAKGNPIIRPSRYLINSTTRTPLNHQIIFYLCTNSSSNYRVIVGTRHHQGLHLRCQINQIPRSCSIPCLDNLMVDLSHLDSWTITVAHLVSDTHQVISLGRMQPSHQQVFRHEPLQPPYRVPCQDSKVRTAFLPYLACLGWNF